MRGRGVSEKGLGREDGRLSRMHGWVGQEVDDWVALSLKRGLL